MQMLPRSFSNSGWLTNRISEPVVNSYAGMAFLASIVKIPVQPKFKSSILHRIMRYHKIFVAHETGIKMRIHQEDPGSLDLYIDKDIHIKIISNLDVYPADRKSVLLAYNHFQRKQNYRKV